MSCPPAYAALRPASLILVFFSYSGLVITDDALYGADSEDRALLAANGDGDWTERHDGPRKGYEPYFALSSRWSMQSGICDIR